MTIAELLDLITTTYNNEKGQGRRLLGERGDPPEIEAIKTLLRNADQNRSVDHSVLTKIRAIFFPLLKTWNISEKPSARLQVFCVAMNALLKNLTPSVNFDLNITLEEIYTLESYENFQYGNAGNSNDDLYLDVKTEPSGNSVLRYLVKTPKGVETVELIGSEYDSIKLKIKQKLSKSAEREQRCIAVSITPAKVPHFLDLTDLTLDEIHLLMRETSKRGHFPMYENRFLKYSDINQSKYSLLLLRKAGLLTSERQEIVQRSSMYFSHLVFVKSLLTIFYAGILTPENQPIIDKFLNSVHSTSQVERAQDFIILEKAEQISPKEKQDWALETSDEIAARIQSLAILQKAGILTPENRAIALTEYESDYSLTLCLQHKRAYSKKMVLPALAKGLVILAQADMLTQENIEHIQLSEYIKQATSNIYFKAPKYLAHILKLLRDLHISTPENISKFIPKGKISAQHPLNAFCENSLRFDFFDSLLDRLHRRGLLIDNFDFVVNNLHTLLDVCVYVNIENLPEHLFTQATWNGIAARINEDADIVQNYIRNLRYGNITGSERKKGDSQSTHKAHESVSASLWRSETSYNLSEEAINEQFDQFEAFKKEIQSGKFDYLNDSKLGENKTNSAIEGITRMVNLAKNSKIKDHETQFPLKKIIALVWKGITDEASHDKTLRLNPKERLIAELYNIENAYVNEENDIAHPSCVGGTINGFVSTLDGIHRDVTILLVNNDTIFELMLSYAKKVFNESVVEEQKKNPNFLSDIGRYMTSTTRDNMALEQWYESCLTKVAKLVEPAMDTKMEEARLLPAQIARVKRRVIKEWIPHGLTALRAGQYMLDVLFPHPEEMIVSQSLDTVTNIALAQGTDDAWEAQKYTEIPKDDFDELVQIIDFALSLERDLISKQTRSSLTASVQFTKINALLDILKAKNVSELSTWLTENFNQLNAGIIFSHSLKTQIATVKPFGCSQLDDLKSFFEEKQSHGTRMDIK